MASSTRYTLLSDDRRDSTSTTRSEEHHHHDDETVLLGGFATTSPSQPFFTQFHPTLFTRGLALLLLMPAFVIFVIHGEAYAGAIVFISFAIARQLVVLCAHFGSQVVRIHVEIVHEGWEGVSASVRERRIKRLFGLVVDGIILVGLLVTLSLGANELDLCNYSCVPPGGLIHAVVLGFIAFFLLLESAFDFGNPSEITLDLSVKRPAIGQLRFTSSLLYGLPENPEDDAENEAGATDQRRNTARDNIV